MMAIKAAGGGCVPIRYNLSGGAASKITTTGNTAIVTWLLGTQDNIGSSIEAGDIQYASRLITESAAYISVNQATDFVRNKDGWGTLYVRLTSTGLDAPTGSSHAVDGATWHSLVYDSGSNIFFYWQGGPTTSEKDGAVTIEIATDSGGTNIVASGSYTCYLLVTE